MNLSQLHALQRRNLLHRGEPEHSPAAVGGWEYGSNAGSCGQSHAQVRVHEGLDKGDCTRLWCIDANLFVTLFSPSQLGANSVLYLFGYLKGICYKNFSLTATFS